MSVEAMPVPEIEGALVMKTQIHCDNRGFYQELFNEKKYAGEEMTPTWPQVAQSCSNKNVIRGLHTSPYSKFVTILTGSIIDVMYDVREGSPTFGNKFSIKLEDSKTQVLIPAGCAHGFLSLADDTHMLYLQKGTHNPAKEMNINIFDPAIGFEWPAKEDLVISEKDMNAPLLADALKARKESQAAQ